MTSEKSASVREKKVCGRARDIGRRDGRSLALCNEDSAKKVKSCRWPAKWLRVASDERDAGPRRRSWRQSSNRASAKSVGKSRSLDFDFARSARTRLHCRSDRDRVGIVRRLGTLKFFSKFVALPARTRIWSASSSLGTLKFSKSLALHLPLRPGSCRHRPTTGNFDIFEVRGLALAARTRIRSAPSDVRLNFFEVRGLALARSDQETLTTDQPSRLRLRAHRAIGCRTAVRPENSVTRSAEVVRAAQSAKRFGLALASSDGMCRQLIGHELFATRVDFEIARSGVGQRFDPKDLLQDRQSCELRKP